MSVFSDYILKLLNDYKRILKRYMSVEEREKTIIELGLKRKSLKSDNDAILYNKAHRTLKNIEYWTCRASHTATEHSGIDEFYQHLKKYLNDFRIENNFVVHMSQKVSCAIVQAIQLMALPVTKLSENSTSNKLNSCIQTVAKFGSKEQRIMLANALQTQKGRNSNIFGPILDKFTKYQNESFVQD